MELVVKRDSHILERRGMHIRVNHETKPSCWLVTGRFEQRPASGTVCEPIDQKCGGRGAILRAPFKEPRRRSRNTTLIQYLTKGLNGRAVLDAIKAFEAGVELEKPKSRPELLGRNREEVRKLLGTPGAAKADSANDFD